MRQGKIQPRPRGGSYPKQKAQGRSDAQGGPSTVHRGPYTVHGRSFSYRPTEAALTAALQPVLARLEALETELARHSHDDRPPSTMDPTTVDGPPSHRPRSTVHPDTWELKQLKHSVRWTVYVPQAMKEELQRRAATRGQNPSLLLQEAWRGGWRRRVRHEMNALITTLTSWYAALSSWLTGMNATTVTTITAAVATVVIAVATVYYVRLTHRLVAETRKQIMLTQDPVVSILPDNIMSDSIATFTLVLLNSGIAAIEDVRTYTDYFVVLKPENQPLRFYSFGGSQAPNSTIPRLESRQSANIYVEFRNIYERMGQAYIDPKLADPTLVGMRVACMNVLRLSVEYRRAVDGRSFATAKVYIIGGNADALFTNRVGTALSTYRRAYTASARYGILLPQPWFLVRGMPSPYTDRPPWLDFVHF